MTSPHRPSERQCLSPACIVCRNFPAGTHRRHKVSFGHDAPVCPGRRRRRPGRPAFWPGRFYLRRCFWRRHHCQSFAGGRCCRALAGRHAKPGPPVLYPGPARLARDRSRNPFVDLHPNCGLNSYCPCLREGRASPLRARRLRVSTAYPGLCTRIASLYHSHCEPVLTTEQFLPSLVCACQGKTMTAKRLCITAPPRSPRRRGKRTRLSFLLDSPALPPGILSRKAGEADAANDYVGGKETGAAGVWF